MELVSQHNSFKLSYSPSSCLSPSDVRIDGPNGTMSGAAILMFVENFGWGKDAHEEIVKLKEEIVHLEEKLKKEHQQYCMLKGQAKKAEEILEFGWNIKKLLNKL